MSDRITYEDSGWHFTCAPARRSGCPKTAFLALAKREPFVSFDPIREPGEMWFEFGSTAAEALASLTAELIPGRPEASS